MNFKDVFNLWYSARQYNYMGDGFVPTGRVTYVAFLRRVRVLSMQQFIYIFDRHSRLRLVDTYVGRDRIPPRHDGTRAPRGAP